MKISNVEAFPLNLPMKQNFLISGGAVGSIQQGAPHVYVKITDEDGVCGWGEARPSHRWSYETEESVATTIHNYLKPALIGESAEDLVSLHRKMNQQIAGSLHVGQPIAKAAVDIAVHDLIGKRRKQTLSNMWHSPHNNTIALSYLISTKDPDEAAQKARFAVEQGFRGVDVKIGLDKTLDVTILEAVKQNAPGLFFRVDANQAYNVQQAVRLAKQMERIGVDVFEQPLAANNLFGHAEVRRRTNLPIALDEGAWTPQDIVQAIRAEACDTIVVKLTKMGGLRKAKLCGEIALEAGLGLLGGGLTESGLALTASAHLFNYLQMDTPVDLNGPFFLGDDPLEYGPKLDDSIVTLPDGYGIGCTVSPEKLTQYSAI
jgi:muconate cycloisomerase